MAANMAVSKDTEGSTSTDDESESFGHASQSRSRQGDISIPLPSTRYSGDGSNSNRAPSPPKTSASRHGVSGRPVRNVLQERASYLSVLSCLTEDGAKSASSLLSFHEEEEKEEVQPFELEASTSLHDDMLSASGEIISVDMEEDESVVPPLQNITSHRANSFSLSNPSGQKMATSNNVLVSPNRMQRLPISQRRFSGYNNINVSSNHSRGRKASLASVSEKSTEDSIASHGRRSTAFSASTSSSSNASEFAKDSASRIARNMSLYMRAGALPVAATVVDSPDELEAELREKLELEIRQELEIEMEEFRRQLVLQMVGAAQPVTANVISVDHGSRMDDSAALQDATDLDLRNYAEALDLTLDYDRANLHTAQVERERTEAAAIRSNTNRELGRLFLQLKSQRSLGLHQIDETEQFAFYDPELSRVVRTTPKKDSRSAPSWNVFWMALAATLILGMLLGVGIVIGVYES